MISTTLRTATCAAMVAAGLGAGPADSEAVAAIERYCQTSWQQAGIPPQEWRDCTQETFVELLGRVERQRLAQAINIRESAERRELHRSIWCVAQRWRRGARHQQRSTDVGWELAETAGHATPVDRLADQEQLARALDALSDTQQEVLVLWSRGHSMQEVGERLQMSAARASDHKYKALRKLHAALGEEEQG